MMKSYMCLALLALMPAAVQAQDCTEAATQIELTACAEANWQAADAELNQVWKDAMALMKAIDADLPEDEQGAAAQLRGAQRAWIAFRDANCAAEGYLVHGGTAEPMVVLGCMSRLTQGRSADLRALASAEY